MRVHLLQHRAQLFGVFQHRARAQVVFVEGLAVVVSLEQRRAQHLEQRLLADVGIGIVDEYARVGVAVRVDVQVAPPAMQPPTNSPSFWKSIAKMGFVLRTSRILWYIYVRCSGVGSSPATASLPTGM